MRKILILTLLFLTLNSNAASNYGRLGLGMTNELANGVPALSMKVRKNKTFSIGGIAGIRSNPDNKDYGFGLKIYNNIYDETNLIFYSALLLAATTYQDDQNESKSSFQVNAVLGSEFFFPNLESLGFSFEFGLSSYKDESGSNLSTLGNHFLKAGIHFYI